MSGGIDGDVSDGLLYVAVVMLGAAASLLCVWVFDMYCDVIDDVSKKRLFRTQNCHGGSPGHGGIGGSI
eukprot:15207754-Ditylum_brightwellii.AAC.1